MKFLLTLNFDPTQPIGEIEIFDEDVLKLLKTIPMHLGASIAQDEILEFSLSPLPVIEAKRFKQFLKKKYGE